MKILDRLPYYDAPTRIDLPDSSADVVPYQVVLTVSLAAKEALELPRGAARFPAVLDTGHSHNLSIRRELLDRWVGTGLPTRGNVRIGGTEVPLAAASVWVHPNRPGSRSLSGRPPYRLDLEEGIAVYPPGLSNPARLPLLGLRALTKNRLKLQIDGDRRLVTLKTGWF